MPEITTLDNQTLFDLGLHEVNGGVWIADKQLGIRRGCWVKSAGAFGRFVGAKLDYLGHIASVWVAWSDEADADGSRRAPHFDEMCTTFDRSNG